MKKLIKYLASFLFLLLVPVFQNYAEPQFEIQESTRNGRVIRPTREGNRVIIDWQTSENEAERVTTVFNNSATVSFSREDQAFLRLDGLLGNTSEINRTITELVSHYHDDHINPVTLTQCLSNNSFMRIIAPYPAIDAILTDSVFLSLVDYMGNTPHPQNYVLDVTPPDTAPLNLTFRTFGNFMYSSFTVSQGLTIELFKYLYPHESNPNDDGLIYRITHNGVSYLLFGDFDDPSGIENLLDTSAEIERRRTTVEMEIARINEEQSELFLSTTGEVLIMAATSFSYICPVCHRPHLNRGALMRNLAISGARLIRFENTFENMNARINALEEQLANMPTLRSDVIKWPHHASQKITNDVIIKMNEVIDPRFIIWQTHPAQKKSDLIFNVYIKQNFDFHDKFLCSDGIDFYFISLLEMLREERVS